MISSLWQNPKTIKTHPCISDITIFTKQKMLCVFINRSKIIASRIEPLCPPGLVYRCGMCDHWHGSKRVCVCVCALLVSLIPSTHSSIGRSRRVALALPLWDVHLCAVSVGGLQGLDAAPRIYWQRLLTPERAASKYLSLLLWMQSLSNKSSISSRNFWDMFKEKGRKEKKAVQVHGLVSRNHIKQIENPMPPRD